ncbi:MAG: flavodoxin family protein [Candidatus Omnitrophota bacterium]|nr:MAG: flavodoxin family protein [Candidatus Omnitrophota bacterium]
MKIRKKYVLGIMASPRISGNSDILLDRALLGARNRGAHTEKIILNCLNFSCCQECESPGERGVCKIKDDLQDVYLKINQANALILCSPIFFGSLSAQAKMLIDRFQCFWQFKRHNRGKIERNTKKAAFICVSAGKREDFFLNARSIVKNFFATLDADYITELFCPLVEHKADILEHPKKLDKAFILGETLVKSVSV